MVYYNNYVIYYILGDIDNIMKSIDNVNFIDAWKNKNDELIKPLPNYKSIIRHINSSKFIDSSKKDITEYLSNIYNNINKNKDISNIHDEQNVELNIDMKYLADKVDSISLGIDRVNNILKEVLDSNDKIVRSYENFNELSNSFDIASKEIRKAVRMLKTKLGYSIITDSEKDRIYQTEDFQSILKKCTDDGGSFKDCMEKSLNKFLEIRGLI